MIRYPPVTTVKGSAGFYIGLTSVYITSKNKIDLMFKLIFDVEATFRNSYRRY